MEKSLEEIRIATKELILISPSTEKPESKYCEILTYLIMKYFKIIACALLVSLSFNGCDKEKLLPPNHAKGKIIKVTGGCYGEIVLIEVENPKGLGSEGTFATIGEADKRISYSNAIGVPYFSKTGIPVAVPQTVGTWLYFEFRELTEEEKQNGNLFSPNPLPICQMNISPPSVNRLIITNIISYK